MNNNNHRLTPQQQLQMAQMAAQGGPKPMQVELPPINLMNDIQLVALVAAQLPAMEVKARVDLAADIVAHTVVMVQSFQLKERIQAAAIEFNAERTKQAEQQ